MPVEIATIETLIKQALPDATVAIEDLRGDGNYLSAHVTSGAFQGLSRLEQHRLVYKALEDTMSGALHALALHTTLPTGDHHG